jgi:mannose-6-phosphate isomerase-like protein (cupin superfamily)
MRKIWLIALFAVFSAPLLVSQTSAHAQVFSAADLQHQLATLAASAESKGSDGATLLDYPTHALKLSVRSETGGAEVHAHFDDVIVVTGGTAELVTGGTVIDARSGNDGETTGSGIRNGKSEYIAKGDIVHIPAGTPHQMIIPKGVTFSAFVVKVREATMD